MCFPVWSRYAKAAGHRHGGSSPSRTPALCPCRDDASTAADPIEARLPAEYSRLPRRGLMVMMAFISSSSGPQSATASEITSGGNRKLAKTEIARGEVTGSVSRHPQSTNATAPSGVPPYGPASVASSVNQFERNEISGWADRGHEADGVLARSGVVRSGCP